MMMEEKSEFKALETKRILIYLGCTFLITYLVEIGVIRPLVLSNDEARVITGQMMVAMVMFIPALGVLITRLITKEGFQNLYLKQKTWKGNVKYYVMAWIGPSILTLLGAVVYFLVFRDKFDANMAYMADMYKQNGVELTAAQMREGMISQIIMAVILGPVLNAVNCFGEEWGWRGYLLPKMKEKFSVVPTILIIGVIWGLWHAPLTAVGHNYGMGYWGFPFTGILAMCVFSTVLGTIFSYLTIKTGSCVPALLAHGAVNGIASIGVFYTTDGGNPFIGPAPTGIAGGIFFILAAVICAVLWMKEEKKQKED